jgi:hypothetical protein
MTTATNPTTGVEYYTQGLLDGQSVSLYVPVPADGQVVNPTGVRWPAVNGNPHDKPEEYYKKVDPSPVPFDPDLFRVDDANSGWILVPTPGALPGHPQGTYEKTEVIIRRSQDELRQLVQGYYARAQSELWPQDPGYDQMYVYAEKKIAAKTEGQDFRDIVARHELLMAATFTNRARLNQLYAEIEAAGESGPLDFNPREDWINGIEP